MGKPLKYPDEDLFSGTVDGYFALIFDDQGGKIIGKLNEVWSKAGLLRHLDIDRHTYSDYKQRYPNAIKRAENKIEEWWVNRLAGTTPTGAIFYLKNAFHEDYKDRTETDLTSGGKPFSVKWEK